MRQPNRLDLLSAVTTVPRQTPQRDFGTVLAKGLSAVVSTGASLVSGAFAHAPLLSTAVSGVQSVAKLVAGVGPVRSASTALSGGGLGSVGALDAPEIRQLLDKIEAGGELTPGEYLVLQRAMQQESQQYTAVSNILKVRADSAKAAINNIR